MMLTFSEFLLEKYTKIPHTQMGSNDGGIHTDDDGNKTYLKYYNNGDQAKSEVLTSKIYNMMGIKTLSPKYENIDGRHAVITKFDDNLSGMKKHDFERLTEPQAHDMMKMYHGATLTKNWDIVGLVHDNVMRGANNSLVSVDQGGTFNFRAQGGHKDYGGDVAEHQSLLNPDNASGHVFLSVKSRFPKAEKDAIESVRNLDMNKVKDEFEKSGISNWQDLHSAFVSRRDALLKKY